jgi:hypothetical protein
VTVQLTWDETPAAAAAAAAAVAGTGWDQVQTEVYQSLLNPDCRGMLLPSLPWQLHLTAHVAPQNALKPHHDQLAQGALQLQLPKDLTAAVVAAAAAAAAM